MRIVAIIPARLESTRLPGKPLIDVCGMPMIERVYKQVAPHIPNTYVATNSTKILGFCEANHIPVIMTESKCNSGTERVAVAYSQLFKQVGEFDFVINVQGDEPLIRRDHLKKVTEAYDPSQPYIITTCAHLTDDDDDLNNRDNAFVTISNSKHALYFSRFPIPYDGHNKWRKHVQFYKTIGIYGYSPKALRQIVTLEETRLEKIERLEQLRWLENDYQIRVEISKYPTISVDTPFDLMQVKRKLDFPNES